MFGVWWLNCFVILIVPVCFLSIKKSKGAFFASEKNSFLLSWFNTLRICFLMTTDIVNLRKYKGEFLELVFPLKNGVYYVVHGGNAEGVNHHYLIMFQKYVLDIVKINSWGFRANGLIPSSLNAYKIFKDRVFAPCSDQVIVIENQLSDNIPLQMDSKNLRGNYVILYCKDYSVLLVHLKKGSVSVSMGGMVKEGIL